MIRHSRNSSVLAALLVLFGLPALLSAQNGFVRSITFDPFNADIQAIPATGGYLLAGRFIDSLVPTMVFMELDVFCRTQAVHGYTSAEEMDIASLVPLAGGNYAGIGFGYNALGAAGLSLLVDAQGQVSQPRMIGEAGFYDWLKAVALPDSGFVAVGKGVTTASVPSATIARFNRNGDTLWTRQISRSTEFIQFAGVTALPGGDLMAMGNRIDTLTSQAEMFLMRFSPAGAVRWAKRCTTAANTSIFASGLAINGTKLFTALTTTDISTTVNHMGVASLDTSGNVSWATDLGGFSDAAAGDVHMSASGNPLVMGYYGTSIGSIPSLAALDGSTGNLLWGRGYDLNGEAEVFQALPLSGGRFLLLAQAYTSADPTHLIETMQDGMVPGPCSSLIPGFQATPLTFTTVPMAFTVRSGMSVSVPVLGTSTPFVDNILNCEPVAVDPGLALLPVQVLPHPMLSSARLLLPGDFDRADAWVQVTDMGGRTVDMAPAMTDDGFELHRNGLPAGLYAYQILQGGRRVAAGKLVLQDGF